ncbi:MAG: glycine cleavage system aminomethyltransferase GcvT [Alphaproteobacteria bacterium]|nr:glycine cleavage system aminomethyltransferase GcvT [Alphaproteobacteria bacterium]
MTEPDPTTLEETPLAALHRELGARMVPFAGYLMPVHFAGGILAEHQHCRSQAALFDVSHMGQARLSRKSAVAALETLVPGDISGLPPGRIRYTMFTNAAGGVEDDLMVTNAGDHLFLVVNASRKAADLNHLRTITGEACELVSLPDRALLALQGPAAGGAMARLAPEVQDMTFLSARSMQVAGIPCFVCRSGYTGEDGFEISVAAADVLDLARRLLALPEVRPAGLGARDSLRLEAGLSLYGNDLTPEITPVEAGLAWVVGKRRREGGGFPGADIILDQIASGPKRRRVGLKLTDRVPARAHAVITDEGGRPVGEVTSGGFSPSLGHPIAMGYVDSRVAAPGTALRVIVRDVPREAIVTPMPFVAHRYKKD